MWPRTCRAPRGGRGSGLRSRSVELRQIEPADARVLHGNDNILGVVGAAIAHDEQLEVFQRLRQNRMDCHFEDISAVVGWHRTLNSGVAAHRHPVPDSKTCGIILLFGGRRYLSGSVRS